LNHILALFEAICFNSETAEIPSQRGFALLSSLALPSGWLDKSNLVPTTSVLSLLEECLKRDPFVVRMYCQHLLHRA
jgi:hypothetical protein